MLPNQSHAPTSTNLEKLDTAASRVQTNLRGHTLVHCYSHRLRKIAGHLDMLKEVAEELRREIADELHDRRYLPRIAAEIAAGAVHDGFSLVTADGEWERFEADRPVGPLSPEARVETAEIEARANGWYSYTPHPEAVGGCDVAIHAQGNTSLDGERRCG